MENLKIRVTTEQESKEVQELFFELGYGWHGKGKLVSYSDEILSNGFGWLVLWKPPYLTNTVIQMGSGFEDCKEITLQELRDMVVLTRNDPKDATHESDVDDCDDLYFVDSSKNLYRWFCGSHWAPAVSYKGLLKPIKEEAMKESLNDKIATAEVARQQSKNIDATLAERQSQYGSFEDVAFVTENIIATLAKVRSNGLQDLPHTHRMALYMIASKMARIVNGDFNHLDSWHDIGGYSKLIEDLITVDQ